VPIKTKSDVKMVRKEMMMHRMQKQLCQAEG
jgi:hypothetical protein